MQQSHAHQVKIQEQLRILDVGGVGMFEVK